MCVCAQVCECAFRCCFVSANGLLVDVCQCCCLFMFVCLPLSRHFPCCSCKTWWIKNLNLNLNQTILHQQDTLSNNSSGDTWSVCAPPPPPTPNKWEQRFSLKVVLLTTACFFFSSLKIILFYNERDMQWHIGQKNYTGWNSQTHKKRCCQCVSVGQLFFFLLWSR